MKKWVDDYISDQQRILGLLSHSDLTSLIERVRRATDEERQIFTFGNGGSAANASHFATDLGKGASHAQKKRFRIVSLNENVPWLTALANDHSYEEVFTRQLEIHARPQDVVLVMSVSGNSPNLVHAVKWANEHDLHTIALLGKGPGRLSTLAREVIHVDTAHFGRAEDAHMTLCHLICYALMELKTLG